jgi:hypothetical protein
MERFTFCRSSLVKKKRENNREIRVGILEEFVKY